MWTEGDEARVLFRVRRGVLKSPLQQVALKTFLAASRSRVASRGLAAGLQVLNGGTVRARTREGTFSASTKVASHISGFFDRPLVGQAQRAAPDGTIPCRTTAFTRKHPELWRQGLPFVNAIDALYRKLAPRHYAAQLAHASRAPPEFIIPGTVFSTVTSNYNWRTAAHRDSGDFEDGLGNLAVVGEGYRGCCLGFPQFGIALELQPGDYVLFDAHQLHCNTELFLDKPDAVRLSFVLYLRHNMVACRSERTRKKMNRSSPGELR